MKYQLGRKVTLASIEALLAQPRQSNGTKLHEVWLSREFGAKFFVESRIVALLLTLSRSPGLRAVDWSGGQYEGWEDRFRSTISGLAACAYSPDIKTNVGRLLDIDFVDTKTQIELKDGLAEADAQQSSRVKTYCAFDDDNRRRPPLAFAMCTTKEQFCSEFDRRIHADDWLHGGQTPEAALSERRIAEFAFEIYQNTAEHGVLSASHRVMRGFRFLQVRRHIARTKAALLERAESFEELRKFLAATVGGSERDPQFGEISAGDQGLGIVDRLTACRSDLAAKAESWQARWSLLNRITQEGLSCKMGVVGAGHGLERVLESLDVTGGFLSIRTGDLWVYYAGKGGRPGRNRKLLPVGAGPWAPIQGTFINILFRLQ